MTVRPASALIAVAHPDDCEFGCGGTAAKWAHAGAAVTLIVLTDGSKGSHDPVLSDDALRDRREAEQRAAAAILGLTGVRFLRQVDGELAEDAALAGELAAAIRELRPEVVITHDPWRLYELHPDHPVAGRLVRLALYLAQEPRAARELAGRGLAPWRPDELWLFRPEQPDHHEDVTDTFTLKVRALLCHRSQFATSFGIDGDEGRERFLAALRDDAANGDRLLEPFRRLRLRR